MELVGWKQTIKNHFLAALPDIVPWCIAKSRQVMSSLTDSLVSSERHHSNTFILVLLSMA